MKCECKGVINETPIVWTTSISSTSTRGGGIIVVVGRMGVMGGMGMGSPRINDKGKISETLVVRTIAGLKEESGSASGGSGSSSGGTWRWWWRRKAGRGRRRRRRDVVGNSKGLIGETLVVRTGVGVGVVRVSHVHHHLLVQPIAAAAFPPPHNL